MLFVGTFQSTRHLTTLIFTYNTHIYKLNNLMESKFEEGCSKTGE